MAIAELVTAEQYLHTSFEHDAEFVDGRIVQRPMPTWEHASMQSFLIRELWPVGRPFDFYTIGEQRVQVLANRFRVPDVCVVTEKPDSPPGRRIVTKPPYLCVEVLSPDEPTAETQEKIDEYLAFGVPWVWVIDPISRTGEIYSPNTVFTVSNGIFTTGLFSIDTTQADL